MAALALAAPAALAPVQAADRTWSGGAGPDAPYWDLESNWLDGPPLDSSDHAWLQRWDSWLRQGSFRAASVSGSGRLTMSGGMLSLGGGSSRLGHLDLRGGELTASAASTLTLDRLSWTDGQLGSSALPAPPARLKVVVNGRAELGGTSRLRGGSSLDLELNGTTIWTGSSLQPLYSSSLRIGARGTFHDAASPHRFRGLDTAFSSLTNDGHYLKTGAHRTTIATDWYAFQNHGTLTVREGQLQIDRYPNGSFSSNGTIHVDGGTFTIERDKNDMPSLIDGKVTVHRGALHVGRVLGSARWQIGAGGLASMSIGNTFAGTIRNQGTLQLSGAVFDVARLDSTRGRLEVVGGNMLNVRGNLNVAGLRIAESLPQPSSEPIYSVLTLDGALTVGDLDWQDGRLDVTGPVRVRGHARLRDGAGHDPDGERDYFYGKRIDTTMEFLGRVDWEGNLANVDGRGTIVIAPGALFSDQNDNGTSVGPDGERVSRIQVARMEMNGRYLKTGVAATEIGGVFNNRGKVQVTNGSGRLRFTGALDNAGQLEAVRSRIQVDGSLKQWDAESRRLTGGYIARDGTIALNLGQQGGLPALIGDNGGTIVLDGRGAELASLVQGQARNALQALVVNSGEIRLQHRASLATQGSLTNRGVLRLEDGDTLWEVKGDSRDPKRGYLQQGADSATWVDGTLDARRLEFEQGRLGAGGEQTVGTARLRGDVSLGDHSLLDVDIASLGRHDRLLIDGTVSFGGSLQVDFLGTPVLGSYKVVDGWRLGLGTFEHVWSNLDSALYRLDVSYGHDGLTLTVASASPVPEPGSWALMGLGLAAMVRAGRRRRRLGCGRAPCLMPALGAAGEHLCTGAVHACTVA
ncbi:PEP-CTERM sorting domain-containing protein [Eleftheria terrae]|uniref:PEP-CTERM sorting domain-containing protein n=1 Tax=Eleftheria terrae TaxID=1597781 RepID=UPI00263AAFAC|nr:PEP-CTERM sorting domain-containing protein [Eleftheria terrae]WKB52807.1 PEP-CTERM sorting domain-containing protein [Eleftheria terrae]